MSTVLQSELQNLPSGWRWVRLGEICSKPQYGWTTKARAGGGGVKLLRTTDITSGYVEWDSVPYCTDLPDDLEKYLVRDGDILISRAGSVGASHLVSHAERAVFASYLIRFRPSEAVSGKYLAHFLKSPSYWRQIADNTSGIAVPNVNASKLEHIVLPLAPRRDQQDITAEIDKQFSRLDETVSTLRRLELNLRRYCQAQIAAACPRPGSTLPPGWRWERLPNLGELARGKSKHRPRNDPKLYGGPYPFIQTAGVRASGGRIRRHSQSYNELGLAQSRLWPKGTLCITIAANIAETGILEFDACFPDSVVGLRIEGNPALARYVELYLRSVKDRLHRLAPATAQKNINLEILEQLKIPIPPVDSVVSVVASIEKGLSIAEQINVEIATSLSRTYRLKEAQLMKAFSIR